MDVRDWGGTGRLPCFRHLLQRCNKIIAGNMRGHMKKSALVSLPLLFLVSACGGGDGGSGASGSGGVIVAPAPTPSPTPTPTPTPTPEPSPTPTPTPLPAAAPIAADGNWSTVQGNPGHTGYVATRFSAANFADAWTIATANPPSDVAATSGSVFFNVLQADRHIYTQAVSTTNGALRWSFDLGNKNVYPNTLPFGPSYANGRVAAMAPNDTSSDAPLQVINAATGGYVSTATYDAQFSAGSVPTLVGDELFFAAGYYGNAVFKADAATGTKGWQATITNQYSGYVMEGESVAVDQRYVYYFNAGVLVVLNRGDGTLAQAIRNPFFTRNGISYSGGYVGAPMLADGRIVTFTDNYNIGDALPLAAFALNNDRPLWRSSYSYTGQPAAHGGRLYAVRSSSTIVDVIDATTGLVSASINVGGSENLKSNVVISDSHLFVASAATTFAVDLGGAAYTVAWKTSYGGNLAITPDGYLIIAAKTGLHGVKLT